MNTIQIARIAAAHALIAMFAFAVTADASFSYERDDDHLRIYENGDPVFVYNSGVNVLEGMDEEHQERYRLSCYVHPLYGLDGDVLTQHFPDDHYHHRGVFWAWPNVQRGDRHADVWHVDGVRHVFEEWADIDVEGDTARIVAVAGWQFDDEDAPFVRETVTIETHPADDVGRAIDFHIHLEGVADETVTIRGQGDRGYGGFLVRPNAEREPRRITTIFGEHEDDVLESATPWADYTLGLPDGEGYSGVATFQHPDNPGGPTHPGWILRHYGFLGKSYPYFDEIVLETGDTFEFKYRLYVHRGDAEEGRVAEAYHAFVEEVTAE